MFFTFKIGILLLTIVQLTTQTEFSNVPYEQFNDCEQNQCYQKLQKLIQSDSELQSKVNSDFQELQNCRQAMDTNICNAMSYTELKSDGFVQVYFGSINRKAGYMPTSAFEDKPILKPYLHYYMQCNNLCLPKMQISIAQTYENCKQNCLIYGQSVVTQQNQQQQQNNFSENTLNQNTQQQQKKGKSFLDIFLIILFIFVTLVIFYVGYKLGTRVQEIKSENIQHRQKNQKKEKKKKIKQNLQKISQKKQYKQQDDIDDYESQENNQQDGYYNQKQFMEQQQLQQQQQIQQLQQQQFEMQQYYQNNNNYYNGFDIQQQLQQFQNNNNFNLNYNYCQQQYQDQQNNNNSDNSKIQQFYPQQSNLSDQQQTQQQQQISQSNENIKSQYPQISENLLQKSRQKRSSIQYKQDQNTNNLETSDNNNTNNGPTQISQKNIQQISDQEILFKNNQINNNNSEKIKSQGQFKFVKSYNLKDSSASSQGYTTASSDSHIAPQQ